MFVGPSAALRFDAVESSVGANDDFEVRIDVFDADGSVIGTLSEVRNFDVDQCECLDFPYRFEGDRIRRDG